MAALGNAVVPRVAKRAFAELARAADSWRACASMLVASDLGTDLPRSALLVDGNVYELPHVAVTRTARYPTPRSANIYPTVSAPNRQDTLSTALVHAAPGDTPHLAFLPDPTYVEWMMGFARDWTLVPVPPEEPAETESEPHRSRLNGMHMLMRDSPGQNISAVSARWRALTPEERARYSASARESNPHE
jgi:hypothetical protein